MRPSVGRRRQIVAKKRREVGKHDMLSSGTVGHT